MNKKISIPINRLLRGKVDFMPLEDILNLHRALKLGMDVGSTSLTVNMNSISEVDIRDVYESYGGAGLRKLVFMLSTTPAQDFSHFFDSIKFDLLFSGFIKKIKSEGEEENIGWKEENLISDNDTLKQSDTLSGFNWNVIQPDLSWKLFLPGVRHGFLVYGLGEPRILVSHPFQGINGEDYDVYTNSLDVVTSLRSRGYSGSFLFLDCLHGLNKVSNGAPHWAQWFSIIAKHSDLVLFIKEYDGAFNESQKLEIDLTPDMVQKKIIEIPHDELKWAQISDDIPEHSIFSDSDGNIITEEEYRKFEAEFAIQLISGYERSSFPDDRTIRIDEDGNINEYGFEESIYEYEY